MQTKVESPSSRSNVIHLKTGHGTTWAFAQVFLNYSGDYSCLHVAFHHVPPNAGSVGSLLNEPSPLHG